jgi:GNAT superfamily N-acetyltransferase
VKIDVTVSSDIKPTARMRQVSSMFDAPISDKATRTWSGEAPIEERPWSVGLIVGASGAGKSTVARQMFGDEYRIAWGDKSVIDSFDPALSVEQVSEALSAVGFNTVPAWLRSYGTLSNGEKFRCDLARTLVAPESLVWIDEFTSVVDRQVAKIGSHALARYVRTKPGRQFVAVGCHYDVIDWLQPDWVLEPANMTFAWRSVQRRPVISGELRRAPRSLWREFAPYHYMSAELSPQARCFAVYIDDRPVAFAGVLPLPVSAGKYKGTAIDRVTRVVVLPDWQGCGLVFRILETLGAAYATLGRRFRTYPAHHPFIRAFLRKADVWNQKAEAKNGINGRSQSDGIGSAGGRPCAVFEYVGPTMDRKLAERLLALG